MGWFDDQVRQRVHNDQLEFEESMLQMASTLLGKENADLGDASEVTLDAINEILKYFKFKPVEVPDSIEEAEQQMDYCLHKYGVMRRNVTLREQWWKDAMGPMILFRKESRLPVVALPGRFGGYELLENGIKRKMNPKRAGEFAAGGVCFYRPLPPKPLTIRDLLLFMKNCISGNDLVFTVGLTLLATMVGMFLPKLTRYMSRMISRSPEAPVLFGTAAFMLVGVLVSAAFGAARSLMITRMNIKTSVSVGAAVMMRVVNLPAGFFREFSSGELNSRVTSINSLCAILIGSILSTGLTVLSSLLYVKQIGDFAPCLVAPALLILTVELVLCILTAIVQTQISTIQMKYAAKESGIAYSLISGIQKIKVVGAEKRAFSKWAEAYSRSARYTYNPPMLLKLSSAILMAVGLAGTILLYFTAAQNGVSPEDYIAFSASFGAVTAAFSTFATIVQSVAQISPILELASPILKTEPEMTEEKEIITGITGSIEMSNITFRYKSGMPPVIDDLSLKVGAGEYVAIVGKTGCGKSTLVRLLLGFERPERGAVYYDSKDISTVDLQSLRKQIGTVTQNGSLFAGSIYSNIVISKPTLTVQEAWEAAGIAGMEEDIRMMPMGMFTMISEGQGGVSGGQKQRLMIARAIAPKPKVLIFDEATSALDNRTQKQVSDALDKLKCTRIIIAHRLSTIKHCDRILMLEDGKIVEQGTYEELIRQKGRFADMVERQRLDLDEE